MRVLGDDDIRRELTPDRAVAWMREALLDHAEGRLASPPRVHTDLSGGRLVFTTGRHAEGWFGYRSYDTLADTCGEQVVVVHGTDGAVRGMAVGTALGSLRVGAIGAVAADVLAPADAGNVAVIGTGSQAFAQLWALRAVRDIGRVRVHSRDRSRREAFAQRAGEELGLRIDAVSSAQEAVVGDAPATIVILATNSPVPVVETSQIPAGAYVTTLGPKQRGRAEFGVDLLERADLCATDSPAQIGAYDPPNVLVGTPQEKRLLALGEIVAGRAPGRTRADQNTMFCSVGLAGTEVHLLARLLS
jgi:ornithine cyclodeaminase/alanine dehydrogenase-like protein (mu-crystallin family)